jgi:hypothetical protein
LPTLPPEMPDLTLKQLKRRLIVKSLLDMENNYVAALKRIFLVKNAL